MAHGLVLRVICGHSHHSGWAACDWSVKEQQYVSRASFLALSQAQVSHRHLSVKSSSGVPSQEVCSLHRKPWESNLQAASLVV